MAQCGRDMQSNQCDAGIGEIPSVADQKLSAASDSVSGKFGITNRLNGMVGISSVETETSAQPESGRAIWKAYSAKCASGAPLRSSVPTEGGSSGGALPRRQAMRRMISPSSRKPKDLCSWISSKDVRWLWVLTMTKPSTNWPMKMMPISQWRMIIAQP
ncbi:hypothetical protein AU467_21745 [Mesorhizobium loti]|uniref:Uncharacterized protein n=1 Tax=Rhizobium loti TaxID=381 RepID=A0A117N3Q3_RHILI|nr:hypothetical protein AU467_21745 [Mesorhizobium loti]